MLHIVYTYELVILVNVPSWFTSQDERCLVFLCVLSGNPRISDGHYCDKGYHSLVHLSISSYVGHT